MAPALSPEQEQRLRDLFYGGNFFGRDRLYWILKQDPNNDISRRQVMDFLSKQEIAQTFRRPARRTGVRAIVSTKLGQFQADLLDMSHQPFRSHVAVYTMIDCFSKRLYCKPIKNKEAKSTVAALKAIRRENPNMKITSITTDSGGEFKEAFDDYLKQEGIQHHFIAPHQPWSNGIIERSNATVKRQLNMYMKSHDTKDWVSQLDNLVTNVNKSVSFATGKSPLQIETDQDGRVGREAAKKIVDRAAKSVNQRGATLLKVGDLVRKTKPYKGTGINKPSKSGYFAKRRYVVTGIVESTYANQLPSYKIRPVDANSVRGEQSSHVPMKGLVERSQLLLIPSSSVDNLSRRATTNVAEPEPVEPPPRRSSRTQHVFEVDYILDKQMFRQRKKRITKYLVKWKHFPESEATWQTKSDLAGAPEAIQEFEASRQ